MVPSIVLFAIDSSHLGRLDYASLPQQALMEMLIDGVTNREVISGSQEEPKDVEDWDGVHLNENGEVEEIDWWGLTELEGSLNLEWLPSTVRKISVHSNKLTGSIHLETLPSSLKRLYFRNNTFSGEISLRHLPDGLESLDLSGNQLSGPVDLTNLPVGLQKLYLTDNNFSGETDFSKLPRSLEVLRVSNTQLSGEIHLKEKKYGFNVDNSNVKIVITKYQN